MRLTGLPIRPAFWGMQPLQSNSAARQQLGLIKDVPTTLLVGGGDGVGRLTEIATKTAKQLSADAAMSQVVVVCGRNEQLRQSLADRAWPANVRVVVLGFVPNLDAYMAAADVLVTKAGPGTIAEACALGLPMVLSSYLPGQEAGNVPFVTEGRFGVYDRRPSGIARAVSNLLRTPEVLQEMSNKARQAGRPRATLNIAEDVVSCWLPPLQQQ